jgi:putative membrane protein
MRWFLLLFTIAAVYLLGLFTSAPMCLDWHGRSMGSWDAGYISRLMEGISEYVPLAQEISWPWRMMDYGHGPGMMGYWFGGFFMWIIFIIIIAVVVYLIIRAKGPRDEDALMSETPLNILKKRYARGEISKEEFDEIRRDIEK